MITIYRCENCGEEFADWQTCSNHENDHLKIKSSQLKFYIGDSHPSSVKIVFTDGTSGLYELGGPIKDSSPAIGSSQES